MSIDLKMLTIKRAHAHLLAGDFSAVELAEAYLAEIEKKNKNLNAYLEVFDDVREQAKEADRRLHALRNSPLIPLKKGGSLGGLSTGVPNNPPPHFSEKVGGAPFVKGDSARTGVVSPLCGIPLAVKDNILIEDRRVGAASKILEGYIAPYDATVIKKLKDAGAVFVGRTNCDEFAMGGSTENSAYGVTKNPHDLARVAGGSSGGSAAAVAANLALAALGSDTGGSVRQPASFCGVVGFKPTYGAVSRFGLIAMGSSLDCIGPIAKTVEDAQIIFDCVKGRDPLDSTSIDVDTKRSTLNAKRFTIGIPKGFVEKDGIDADILNNFNDSLERLRRAGAEIIDSELPDLQYALACYYIIMPAEASTNLARYDGVKYGLHERGANLLDDYLKTRAKGFGPEVRRRILVGTYVLSSGYYDAYYNKAVAVRGRIKAAFADAFKKVDVIATPTAPTPAWKTGEKADPLSVYLADVFTVTANIAGVPALSLPSGFAERGGKKLPLGLQLVAAHGREDVLFAAGKLFESAAERIR